MEGGIQAILVFTITNQLNYFSLTIIHRNTLQSSDQNSSGCFSVLDRGHPMGPCSLRDFLLYIGRVLRPRRNTHWYSLLSRAGLGHLG